MTLRFPSPEFDESVAAVCHGRATDEQLQQLHAVLRDNAAARDEYLIRVELHSRLASEPDLFAASSRRNQDQESAPDPKPLETSCRPHRQPTDRRRWSPRRYPILVLTACLAAVLAVAGGWWLRHGWFGDHRRSTSRAVAMLNRVVNARWSPLAGMPRLGAALEPGTFHLESGLAQIVFYNGARVVIEGPAQLRLVSSTEATCTRGKLTAEVPPQARGFRIVSPRLEVTDLGTSFGLDVAGGRTELHVFKGEVEYRSGRSTATEALREGNGAIVEATGTPRRVAADPSGFASLFNLQAQSVAAEARQYDQWRAANQRLNQDPSLGVHFDFEHGSPADWRLPNTGSRSASVPDATIVGCQWLEGRWTTKPALEFRGVSDRVRLSVPGSFSSMTLATWVRIQGLDRKISSLFMSDGFEAGTLHWVIRDDGVLGLTVIGPKADHQILASPSVISPEQFGVWMHLAVVIDGPAKQVVHYLNGHPVSHHRLRLAPPYRIGTAELGNWNAIGFPGNDPFLIRNFSGVMDEFCVFERALGAAEIRTLVADGKPLPEATTATATATAAREQNGTPVTPTF